MRAPYTGVAIVGYGQTAYHKRSELPALWYVADAIRRALTSAGLQKEDLDGLAVTSFLLPPDNATVVTEHLGITTSWILHGVYGGASGVVSVLHAARAIQTGDAEVVVCVAADAFTVDSHMELMDRFNTSLRDYVAPYGFGGPNGLFALVQQRHMYEFGTKREQLGKLAITQRRHASLNPNALLRQPLTLEDYLNARIIADPIRLYDCVMPCAGGDAIVLTTVERARKLTDRPIYIWAGAECHNFRPQDVVQLIGPWAAFRADLFNQAAIEPRDLDFIQLYDDYPIMELIQFEDLGFAAKGEGGSFIERTDFAIGGDLPLNTGGGQLSCGQSGAGGGMIGLTEAACQLRQEAGPRQVPGARIGLVSGYGMVGYGRGLSGAAVILSTAPRSDAR